MVDQAIFERLSTPGAVGRTESDIQSDIKVLLLSDAFNLETPRLEEQIGDGTQRRIDIAIGATVIEVKKSVLDVLTTEVRNTVRWRQTLQRSMSTTVVVIV